MTDSEALQRLKALVETQPGILRVVTDAHACGCITPKTERERKRCAAFPFPQTDPRHFACNAITEISEPDPRGRIYARTAEGDHYYGYPSSVLVHALKSFVAESGGSQ